MSNCTCKTEISLHVKMIISVSIHTCKTENLSLIIHMCDDHHQLLKERGGERETEGGVREGGSERERRREREREGGREAKDLGEDFNLT